MDFLRRKYDEGGESRSGFGHLEMRVMEILWNRGESNVRQVVQQLNRPLAYTTVMTTLDRLFKKGLLGRRKSERAFLYSPLLSRQEWQRKQAGEWVAGFLSGPERSGELLISCLIDAVGHHDEALLDDLERKIRVKREELAHPRKP
jgi:predicted transcriptional regulator